MVADYICLFTGTTCISFPIFLGGEGGEKIRWENLWIFSPLEDW